MISYLSNTTARAAWCLAFVASVMFVVPAAARDDGSVGIDRVTTLPAPSMGVLAGSWGVARSGPTTPGDLRAPWRPVSLSGVGGLEAPSASNQVGHAVALLPSARNPLLSYSSADVACVQAKRQRDLGIVLTAVCAISLPLAALGIKVGKDENNADLAISGATLAVVAGIGLPVGIVSMGVAGATNAEHGCWGPNARPVEPAPPPKLVFDGFAPVEEEPAEDGEPADEEAVEDAAEEVESTEAAEDVPDEATEDTPAE